MPFSFFDYQRARVQNIFTRFYAQKSSWRIFWSYFSILLNVFRGTMITQMVPSEAWIAAILVDVAAGYRLQAPRLGIALTSRLA